jgi:two-component system, OmpR family, sensor kinase
MSIKARLTLAVMVLVVVATAVLGLVVVRSTRASMIEQVDARLDEVGGRPGPPEGFGGPGGPRGRGGPPPGEGTTDDDRFRAVAELFYSTDGQLVSAEPAGFPDDPRPLPKLPPLSELTSGPRTVPSQGSGADYRVVARPMRGGGFRVVAASLDDVDATTSDLLRTVLITAGAVLIAGAAFSWWVIRRGLRPVDRMIETAGAIADGDLSRRVEHYDPRTELGQLATALDHMLGQLEAAFDERAASQERLKRFVADASHELRTPIAAIRGYAELYRSGGIDAGEPLDNAMARMESEGERMGWLVEDLLVLARLDQQQALAREPVDMAALARDAVADLRAVDPKRPVTLELDGAAVVTGDEARLRQVVTNLLANARVHTPPGTPVHVHVWRENGEVVLAVADEGPGIDAEHRERVFERFYRPDTSRSRNTGGSGLGLSIVAAVAAAHGGRAALDAATGAGATFTVRLPAAA